MKLGLDLWIALVPRIFVLHDNPNFTNVKSKRCRMAVAEKPLPTRLEATAYKTWEEHHEKMERRRKEREKHRDIQRRCLDPEEAAREEARKPRYDYEVTCKYTRQNKDGHIENKKETEIVNARDENEAWARFCDKIKTWPSPHYCEREINRLKKIS